MSKIIHFLIVVIIYCSVVSETFSKVVDNTNTSNVTAASVTYNNPDTEVNCGSEYNGYCYLYFYGNKTHYRFTPVSKNASAVMRVSLSGRIPVLSDDICKAFPNAEELHLDYASIEEISSGALDRCRKAKIIYLSGNYLRELPSNVFRFNLNVENLYLYNNKLRQLNKWTFASLFKLKYLSLYDNYLTEISPDIFTSNAELETLNLYQNDLLDLDEAKLYENLPSLRTLYLNNNQISCDRLDQIRGNLPGVYVSDSVFNIFRKRYYLQDTINNFLCLPSQTWLNVYNQEKALKKTNSSFQVSLNGLKE